MSKIKFDHAAIYGGVFYPANTPIEVKEDKAPEQGDTEAPVNEETEAPKKAKGKKAGAKDNDNSGAV